MRYDDAGDSGEDRASRRRRLVTILIAVVLVVAIAGVIFAVVAQTSGARSTAGRSDAPGTTEGSSASPSLSPSPPETDPEQSTSSDPAFGEPVADEVLVGEVGVFPDGVTARVASVTPFEATGLGVGEVSGPAVRVQIDLVNASATSLDLNEITVNAYYGASRTPASSYSSDSEAVAFSGDLPPGKSASGAYSFAVGSGDTESIIITVSSRAGTPIVVFNS